MQDFMRKHKKLILGFILLVMVVPFVFFFGAPKWTRGQDEKRASDILVAKVGDAKVTAVSYRDAIEEYAKRSGKDFKTIAESDDAVKIREQLVDAACVETLEQQRHFSVDKAYYQDVMKKWDFFKGEDGNFDPNKWNEWVSDSKGRRMNWQEMYDSINKEVTRQVYMNVVLGAANRVLDKDIEKEAALNYTKFRFKYVKIEPDVVPTEEQLKKQYDENAETMYRLPDTFVADVVAFSLMPSIPANAAEIVQKARDGADFTELADQYSVFSKSEKGGDMGWQIPKDSDLAYRQAMFALQVGQVSDPVHVTGGDWAIFKVTEERTNETTGKREVKVQRIQLRSEMTDDEKAAVTKKAENLAQAANAMGDFAKEAQENGLQPRNTGPFTKESKSIENISPKDVIRVCSDIQSHKVEDGCFVITGVEYTYVFKIAERTQGAMPPMADVLEKVTTDTIAALKGEDAYKARVVEYAAKIKGNIQKLEEITTVCPDLKIEIKETPTALTGKDNLYQDQVYLRPTEIFAAFDGKDPGMVAGPLADFQGMAYFFELLERTPPTEEDKPKIAEDVKKKHQQKIQVAQMGFLQDFRKETREEVLAKVAVSTYQDVIDQVLGFKRVEKSDSTTPSTTPNSASAPGAK